MWSHAVSGLLCHYLKWLNDVMINLVKGAFLAPIWVFLPVIIQSLSFSHNLWKTL